MTDELVMLFIEINEHGQLIFTAKSKHYMDFREVANVILKKSPKWDLKDLRMLRNSLTDEYYYLGLCEKD